MIDPLFSLFPSPPGYRLPLYMNKTQEVFRILQIILNYLKKNIGWMFAESDTRFKRGESETLAVRKLVVLPLRYASRSPGCARCLHCLFKLGKVAFNERAQSAEH